MIAFRKGPEADSGTLILFHPMPSGYGYSTGVGVPELDVGASVRAPLTLLPDASVPLIDCVAVVD